MWTYNHTDDLYHYGVKGMKWGVRKKYRSTGIRSALARRANDKVDESFKKWNENTTKRDTAINLGKKATASKIAYENDKGNKSLKSDYKDARKAYKKALGENTTYRKGVVRQEVGRDAARKYLSEAKRVKKLLDADPNNRELQKRYNRLMSNHDVERADARRAVEVSSKRSAKIASIKRGMTITAKAAAGSAAVAAGAYAVNRYLSSHDVRLNGERVSIGKQNINDIVDVAKKVRNAMSYMY